MAEHVERCRGSPRLSTYTHKCCGTVYALVQHIRVKLFVIMLTIPLDWYTMKRCDMRFAIAYTCSLSEIALSSHSSCGSNMTEPAIRLYRNNISHLRFAGHLGGRAL